MNNYIDYTTQIKKFYENFDIILDVSKIIDSYSITRYFITLDRTNKTKIANVEKLIDDLGVELNIKNIKFSIDFENGGIVFEIPKKNRQTLYLNDIDFLTSESQCCGLKVCFGKDLNNNNFNIDLCETPHLLVAGTTGSGKSMFINSILIDLLNTYTPYQLELLLIDPKRVELSTYKNVKHVVDFADDLTGAKTILANTLKEIEKRYKLLEDSNCRNISSYNSKNPKQLSYKIVIIDELADIILQDKKNKLKLDLQGFDSLENQIVRIAQIGRACGVHLIVATQRPSSDVITGLIKANIPSRVAFSVSSKVDSRIILDEKGAEKLTGKGDLLFKMVGDEELHRIQAPFVSDENIENTIKRYQKTISTITEREPEQKEIKQQTKKTVDKTKIKSIVILTFKLLGILIFPCSIFLILLFLIWAPACFIMLFFIIIAYISSIYKISKEPPAT